MPALHLRFVQSCSWCDWSYLSWCI